MDKITNNLLTKATRKMVDTIEKNLRNYATYEDMKALYSKVIP